MQAISDHTEKRMPTKRKRRRRIETVSRPAKYLVRDFLEFEQSAIAARTNRFIPELADPAQADRLAFNNFVNLTVARGSSYRTAVEEIAKVASRPVPINSLSPVLEEKTYLRGRIFSNHLYRVIDDLTRNWERMFWWISEGGFEDCERSRRGPAAPSGGQTNASKSETRLNSPLQAPSFSGRNSRARRTPALRH